jgi:hypothetical protein
VADRESISSAGGKKEAAEKSTATAKNRENNRRLFEFDLEIIEFCSKFADLAQGREIRGISVDFS